LPALSLSKGQLLRHHLPECFEVHEDPYAILTKK
jgi:hypothetical protein